MQSNPAAVLVQTPVEPVPSAREADRPLILNPAPPAEAETTFDHEEPLTIPTAPRYRASDDAGFANEPSSNFSGDPQRRSGDPSQPGDPPQPGLSLPAVTVPLPALTLPSLRRTRPVPLEAHPHSEPSDAAHSGPEVRSWPASVCDEHHWIASVRHLPQECLECAPHCGFEVMRSNWRGQAVASSEEEMLSELIPGVPVCVVVHGSFVPPDEITIDSRNTFEWLREANPGQPLQVIFLTWPSEGVLTFNAALATSSPLPGLDVAILGRRAELNGFRLARLVQKLPADSPVCLIGHSHGARLVSSALHVLGGGELYGCRLPGAPLTRQVRSVLVAAAIDHDWLAPGQRYDRALCVTEAVLNLRTRHDWALWFYPLRRPFSRTALGRVGFTGEDRARIGLQSSKLSQLDVSKLVGIGHIWPEYYHRPQIAEALVPWVYFNDFNDLPQ